MTVRKINVLDHGYVVLNNIAGQVRRSEQEFDANDVDPALAARNSFDAVDLSRPKDLDLKLVNYLITHKHNTPVEAIEVWVGMKLPIFVARQFIRHRTASVNEVSFRYVKACQEFYVPNTGDIGIRPDNVKQGRDISQFNKHAEWFNMGLTKLNNDAYNFYCEALERGIPPEISRIALNLNLYTKWEWKQNLHNLMHFLRLRLGQDAQWESRQYAQAVHDLLDQHLPNTMELLRKSL